MACPARGRTLRAALLSGAALIGACGAAVSPARAQTWGGAGSTTATTDYNLGTNWSTGVAPVASGGAVFDATGQATVVVTSGPITPFAWTFNTTSQSYTISGAAVNFGDGLTNNANAGQIITISNDMTGSDLTNGGKLVLSGTIKFSNFMQNFGTMTNNGTINNTVLNGGLAAFTAVFNNSGTISAIGTTFGSVNLASTSVVGSIFNNQGGVNAQGQITGIINNEGGFSVTGTLTGGAGLANLPGGFFVVGGGDATLGQVTNGGTDVATIQVSAGRTLTATSVTNTGPGIINNFGTLTAPTIVNNQSATLNTNAATSVVNGNLTNNGIVNAAGQINGAIVNQGLISPSSAPSVFTVTGDLAVNSSFINSQQARLTVSGGNLTGITTLDNSSTVGITVSAGRTLSANTILNEAGAFLSNFGTLTATAGITNSLGVFSTTGVVNGSLANSGTVFARGQINGPIFNTGDHVTGGLFNVTGDLAVNNTFTNDASAGLFVVSGNLTGITTLDNKSTDPAGVTIAAGRTLSANAVVNEAGATINDAGTLTALTSFANSGTLTGPGTIIGNPVINSGGIFAPGNGTPGSSMAVTGNLAFQSGAIYLVQLNPATSSLANVTGTATLGGATVDAFWANGSYVSKKYTILTATGGVNGSFGPLVNTNLPANFSTSLSYDANDAFLNLTLSFAIPGGLNGNQQNVGNALTNFFNTTGGIPMVYASLSPGGLSQAAGETATGSQQTTFDAMTQFMGLLTDPFMNRSGNGTNGTGTTPFAEEADAANAYAAKDPSRSKSERDAYAAIYRKAPLAAPFVPSWSAWAAGYGGSQTTDGNAALGSNNTTSSIAGTAVGADYRFSPFTLAGFALAGGGTNFAVNGFGSGRSDLFQAGAYVRHVQGPAYISAALAYGWQDITTNRTVTIAGVDQLRAEFNANAYSGRVEGGYRFVSRFIGGVGLTPYAAAQFTTFDLPAYAEQAIVGSNAFALAYGARDVTDSRSELGIRTDKSFAMTNSILTLRGRLAWAHDFNPDRSIGATFQALPGASFVVNGAAQASDSALTTASAELKWTNGWSAAATFEGEFSAVTSSYAGKGVVRYAW
jgi:uncharacterized protein with beta-barrel porin domain